MPKAKKSKAAIASKKIVLDASVLRAAGAQDAVHPQPKNCRAALIAILEIPHRAAITEGILAEWKNHSSRFAKNWRNSMYARRLIVQVLPANCNDIYSSLRSSPHLSPSQITAGEKDILLIAAARSADGVILSLDEAARNIFHKVTTATCALGSLLWANPVTEHKILQTWLRDGKPELTTLRNKLAD